MASLRRVALVSDDLMFQSQLGAAIRKLGGSLRSASRQQALDLGNEVDAVFVDLNREESYRLGVIAGLRGEHPDLTIVGFCHHESRATRKMAMRVGATSCVTNGALQLVAIRLAGGQAGAAASPRAAGGDEAGDEP